ncbi:hypothetical protein RN001_004884 [Aquatica leii]|uniref:Uncharacterized protein n=1 Tax=Aquatica leii TaxID=1421715 RepID=A0AAN7SRX3_9COLE|nr:hypothetical protein RN001_004884 [Aquatica leii]
MANGINIKYSKVKLQLLQQGQLPAITKTKLARIKKKLRLCWVICFIGAVVFAGYSVSNIYLTQIPVMVTENPVPASISDIPFPTITICNMNKAKWSVASEIINEDSASLYKPLLSSYCTNHKGLNITSKSSVWTTIINFLIKINYSCSDILKFCMWKSVEFDCDEWFNPIFTDIGMCCAFNLMPSNIIYKSKPNAQELKYNYPLSIEYWNQEKGFEHEPIENSVPWRIEGILTLFKNCKSTICNTRFSAGFKVLPKSNILNLIFFIKIIMYNPMETSGFSRFIPLERECWFEILTTVKETDTDVRSIGFQDRRCYFNREKNLKFFRVYTKANCKTECHVNNTIKTCGCVPYYFPRTDTETICAEEDIKCMEAVTGAQMCDCLSACFELNFEATSHYGVLSETTVKTMFLKNMSAEYFV